MSASKRGLCSEAFHILGHKNGVGSLTDEVTQNLARGSTIILKWVLQNSIKHMYRFNRNKLLISDIRFSLKLWDSLREKKDTENTEINSAKDNQNLLLKDPTKADIDLEWYVSNEQEHKLRQQSSTDIATNSDHSYITNKIEKFKKIEIVQLKRLACHELSVEQQRFYLEFITDCISLSEQRRRMVLKCLAIDPSLDDMLLEICVFISEGVKVNIVYNQLLNLVNLMRMVKSIISNTSLYIEKCLHILLPSVISCVVSKQICLRPKYDNHWALREFSARLISQICNTFDNSELNLQIRVSSIYVKAFENNRNLSSIYGSIFGLSEFGDNAIEKFVIPYLKIISRHIEQHVMGPSKLSEEKLAANKIVELIQKCCAPVITKIRQKPDNSQLYNSDYGFLGIFLCSRVIEVRKNL